jgi:MFS transporter, putative metabolite:H+ symporter
VFGIIYPMISDPVLLPAVGFALTVPIYVLVALLFGVYIPELFPTQVRLRASGIVNTLGRGATIVTPFMVVALFEAHGIGGVMALMIGLLAVQIVAVWAFGIEPRNRSLEELKGEEASPTLVKQVT